MKKKYIIIIVLVLAVLVCAVSAYIVNNNKEENKKVTNVNKSEEKKENEKADNNETSTKDKKVLVVYYSAQNHTKKVAEEIASNLNADTFEIEPVDKYTDDDLDWTNNKSRVSREHENEKLRDDIKLKNTEVPNWDSYDTVLIGYPIWWGIAAYPVNAFVKANDFTGKNVYTFCTSVSSGLGNSTELLKDDAKGGSWKDGKRFSSNASKSEINDFTDSLGL